MGTAGDITCKNDVSIVVFGCGGRGRSDGPFAAVLAGRLARAEPRPFARCLPWVDGLRSLRAYLRVSVVWSSVVWSPFIAPCDRSLFARRQKEARSITQGNRARPRSVSEADARAPGRARRGLRTENGPVPFKRSRAGGRYGIGQRRGF